MLTRLERIEALDHAGAEPRLVLAELRELVREVEVWSKRERFGGSANPPDPLYRGGRCPDRGYPAQYLRGR